MNLRRAFIAPGPLAALLLSLIACSSPPGPAGAPGGGQPGPPPPPPPPPPVPKIEVLARGPAPEGVTVVGGRVVWSEASAAAVRAISPVGGEPVTLAPLFSAAGLGVDGPNIYRAESRFDGLGRNHSTVVVRSSLDGSASEDVAVVSVGVADTRAIMRSGRVVATLCELSPNTCTLRVVPLDGSPSTDLLAIQGNFGILDADETHAYWIENAFAAPLLRIPLAGGAPEIVAEPTAQALFGDFALVGQEVVLSEVDTRVAVPIAQGTLRRLLRVPAAGGARVVLGERTGDGGVLQVMVVGQDVVWRDDAGVYSTPLGGGVTTALAAAPLPADYTYWSMVSSSGTLYCSAMSRGYFTRGFVAPLGGGEGWGDISAPYLFAADDTFLYWHASTAQLSRAPAKGGPVEAIAGGFGGRPRLAQAGGRLFGAERMVVKEVDLAAGVPHELLLADDTIRLLAADVEAAYAVTAAGSLWRIPAAGGTAQLVSGNFFGAMTRFRAAGGFVYWNESLPPSSPSFSDGIYRMPGAGGDRAALAEVPGGIEDLIVAGDFVYFKARGGGISRVPTSGGAVQPLITVAMGGPMVLAADATHLYAAGGTDVFKLPLAGGAIVSLHSGEFIGPNALAVDATAVYWTDSYYEAVFRLSPK